MLVICLVLTGTSTVHAQGIAVPAWVPTKVTGWNLAYNSTLTGELDVGGDNVVTNWTQLWFKNDTGVIAGVVGVVSFEYKEDYFGKAVPVAVKNAFAAGYSGLPAFTGNTVWDLFEWMMTMVGNSMGSGIIDQKGNITGSDGAFSLNLTGGLNFYLLYAYRNKFAMMIFAMTLDEQIDDWVTAENKAALNGFMGTFVTVLVAAFASIMTLMTYIGTLDASLASAPDVAAIAPTGDILPTAGATSETEVRSFGTAYIGQLPGGIPGYPVFLVGIASLFAVLFIVQKKRKAIVA
jgi:hypothetical protein